MNIVVLDSFTTDQGQPAWDALRRLGTLTLHARSRPGEALERCRGADAVITNKVMLSGAHFQALPGLRYVGVCATGTNVVEIAAARARGIAVTNVPGYSTESVAQLTFALILHLANGVALHAAAVKSERWAAAPDFCFFLQPMLELAGKTLVIVGQGAIGGAVARIGAGFGMEVVAAAVPGSPTQSERAPLGEALAHADIVSLHCPLTPATEKLVNADFLGRLKPSALLINTSRGGLIDERALIAALQAGRLGGVGLDVLAQEPPLPRHPLTDPAAPWSRRVAVTPHIAWGTAESRQRLQDEVAANLAAFQAGQRRNRVD
jgi:glycerate dehydrogenase